MRSHRPARSGSCSPLSLALALGALFVAVGCGGRPVASGGGSGNGNGPGDDEPTGAVRSPLCQGETARTYHDETRDKAGTERSVDFDLRELEELRLLELRFTSVDADDGERHVEAYNFTLPPDAISPQNVTRVDAARISGGLSSIRHYRADGAIIGGLGSPPVPFGYSARWRGEMSFARDANGKLRVSVCAEHLTRVGSGPEWLGVLLYVP